MLHASATWLLPGHCMSNGKTATQTQTSGVTLLLLHISQLRYGQLTSCQVGRVGPAPASSFLLRCQLGCFASMQARKHHANLRSPLSCPCPRLTDRNTHVGCNALFQHAANRGAAKGIVEHQHWEPCNRCFAAYHYVAMPTDVTPVLQDQAMAGPGKTACMTSYLSQSWPYACPAVSVSAASHQLLALLQAVFSLGFALASLYHMCHMHQAGLSESSLLGVSGPVWRTFDILCAQFLLGRTFSHAIGASHWVTHGQSWHTCSCQLMSHRSCDKWIHYPTYTYTS